ncbi:glucosaminidase domain-containing protein [Patescibacteria group bacterium]|nr:glucosaminidase domain-containing protein [Patescibacteria group bacterium]
MKKYILSVLILPILFTLTINPVWADEYVVTQSATLKRDIVQTEYDYRVNVLTKYLSGHNSPLTDYAGLFIYTADKYGLDWRLIPAISGVESTFGKNIPSSSYNAYGWANGKYRFESWEDSIEVVSKALREKYIDRGASTLSKIARRYAASTAWEWKVRYFMNEIDSLPLPFTI